MVEKARRRGPLGPLMSWGSETSCGRESHTLPKGSEGAPREFEDPLVTRCGRESLHQQRGPLALRLSSTGEQERHNADDHKSGDQYIAVQFGLQLPLTHKHYNKMRGTYFSKEVFARPLSLCRCDPFCIYMHIYYVSIQHHIYYVSIQHQFRIRIEAVIEAEGGYIE